MTLTPQEQERRKVLDQHLAGKLSVAQVAALLTCTQRHIYRLKAAYREKGEEALRHGNRGKTSAKRIEEATRQQITELAQGRYAGCNQRHVRDLLEERDGIKVSRASVRRILQEQGVWEIKPAKRPKHRLRRPRYKQEGQLIQVDASPHDWLQERGPRLTLVGGIDDATGKVVGVVFRAQEDQQGYMQVLRQMVERDGRPQAVYHDRHTMFPQGKYQVDEKGSIQEQVEGKRQDTQLGRLFAQLGITSIAARSPQAKGRIERLWGTFQDRLVSELRLAGACTIEQANAALQEYLPRFNARFAVPAADPELAWRAVPADLCLQECFCFHEPRTVALDNTISYHTQRIQLLPTESQRSWGRCKVEVHEHFDGRLSVFYQGQVLRSRLAPADPAHLRAKSVKAVSSEGAGEAAPAGAASPAPSEDTAPTLPTEGTGQTPVPPTDAARPSAAKTHQPKADHPWRRRAVSARPS